MAICLVPSEMFHGAGCTLLISFRKKSHGLLLLYQVGKWQSEKMAQYGLPYWN